MQQSSLSTSRHAPSLFWPIILIGTGVILLLSNMGLLAVDAWAVIWRLWPVLLIIIGLDILLCGRGLWASLASLVLGLMLVAGVIAFLFVAQSNPALLSAPSLFSVSTTLRTEHIAHPLSQIRSADVHIDFHGGNGSLYAVDDSSNLYEGDVTSYGSLVNSVSQTGDRAHVRLESGLAFPVWSFSNMSSPNWKLGLNTGAEYDLDLVAGSGSYQFDLSQLTLRSLAINGGSGSMTVNLPSKASYRFNLHTGSGSTTVRLPEGTAARIEYKGGTGSVSAPNLRQTGRDRRSGIYETANFSTGGPYVMMTVDVGSGSITIR
jgi:hypothetical protein